MTGGFVSWFFLGKIIGGLGELDREIDFDFDFGFDSFVRGGRGEAVCACETCLLDAGADLSGVVLLRAAGL